MMKKTMFRFSVGMIAFFFAGGMINNVQAATTTVNASLGIQSTLTLSCNDGLVTMGSITGTGQSALTSNYEDCNVKTNNSTGYNLGMLATTATLNSGSDTIAAYTPTAVDTPETWSVSASASEWAYHLGSSSTTPNTALWGAADTYAGGKWLNAKTTNFVMVSRPTETSAAGDTERVYFGAEVGASAWQPTGTYTNNTVTLTALVNP